MSGLKLKLTLATLLLVALIAAANLYSVATLEENLLRQQTTELGSSLGRSVAIQSAYALQTDNPPLLLSYVNDERRVHDVMLLEVVGEGGRILASQNPARLGLQSVEGDTPLTSEQMRFMHQGSTEVLDVLEPVFLEKQWAANVHLIISLDDLRAQLAASQRYRLGSTLAFFIIALVSIAILANWWTRPISDMAKAARRLGEGNLTARAPAATADEVGVLALAFNDMASKLQALVDEERDKRLILENRVAEMLALTQRFSRGERGVRAPRRVDNSAAGTDEMDRIADGFNIMVQKLETLLAEEQSMRNNLERSKAAMEVTHLRLQELDRHKSEFLNIVSHELRTPLTSLKAFSELLLDAGADDPDIQHEFLGIMQLETERLTHLINNLLDLSRIEAGRVRWKRENVDLQGLIHDVYASLHVLAEQKRLKVILEIPNRLPIVGDSEYLKQIVWNLMSNAVKFTPPEGMVSVRGQEREGATEIIVTDSGVGIPTMYHSAIFDKFWRVPDGSREQSKGSGLGLAVARAIVDAHHGTIKVESEPGAGSTFTVSLPTLGLGPASAVEEGAPTPFRLVVMSDKIGLVETLRSILEEDGHMVIEQRETERAFECIRACSPDAIFLDVFMQEGQGFDLLRDIGLAPDLKHLPVWTLALMDGHQNFCPIAEDFFRKPIDSARLLAAISRLAPKPEKETTVLVVDDDPSVLEAITQLLVPHGFRILRAHDGIEAIVKAREEHPDIMVLDVYMPHMNGLEVIRRLRARDDTARVPIIVLTASDVQLDRAKMLEQLADATRFNLGDSELAQAVHSALQSLPRR